MPNEIHYTDTFDEHIEKIDHFIKYPEMMPWVGKEYPNAKIKILHIGESHYIKKLSKAQLDAKAWYAGKARKDLSDSKSWIATRSIVNKYVKTGRKRNRKIFHRSGEVFCESGLFADTNQMTVYYHLAFMNFFQRPALQGLTYFRKHCESRDCKIANKVFQDIVEIIQPDAVAFTSCFAYGKAKSGGSIKFLDERNIRKCRAHHIANNRWCEKSKKILSNFVNSLY